MNKLFVMIIAMFAMASVAHAEVFITIDKSEQEMVVQTPDHLYVWNVSTARKGYFTPTGIFQPYLLKPMHYSSKYDNAPMPNSVFFLGGYAIHATGDVKHLGRPASHGCVRLSPENAWFLFETIKFYGKENTYITIVE